MLITIQVFHNTLSIHFLHNKKLSFFHGEIIECRGGSRAAATSKMERFVIIVNGWKLEAVNYYHKALHLGCCSSPRSASGMHLIYHLGPRFLTVGLLNLIRKKVFIQIEFQI